MDCISSLQKLSHVPWALDGRRQPLADLLRTIENESLRFQEEECELKFSLLTPMWNTNPTHLEELILSCLGQSYPHWELILQDDCSKDKSHYEVAKRYADLDQRIKFFENEKNQGISGGRNAAIQNSSGKYLAILDHDDLLHPQILGIYARKIKDDASINFLFSNECKVSEDSRLLKDFFNKPCFDLQTLLRTNYICHFTAIHRDVYENAKNSDTEYYDPKYDGVEDHEFFLRCALKSDINAAHFPLMGYLWRISSTSTAGDLANKPWVVELGTKMVEDKAKEIYSDVRSKAFPAKVTKGERLFRLRFEAVSQQRKIGVIVPFRDKSQMTIKCLESLENQDTRSTLQIILVNNSSQSHERENIKKWTEATRNQKYEIIDYDGAFNYGAMNNEALRHIHEDAESILFLNNDVTLSNRSAVDHLAICLFADDHIGYTSTRLNFPGTNMVQYGGVEFSNTLVGSGAFLPRHMDHSEDFAFDDHVNSVAGFACCLVKRSVLHEIGPLNDGVYANGLGDVEWCLRAQRAGYTGFYIGSIAGEHEESKSRSSNAEDLQLNQLHKEFGTEILKVRSEQMSYNKHMHMNSQDLAGLIDYPLRYVIADKMNEGLKTVLGPLHRQIKSLTSRKVSRS